MSRTEATESVSRPILFNGDMVRAILSGQKTVTRRPVVVARSITSIPRGHLTDMGRAWADRGFPLDDDDTILPMERWGRDAADPAPESAYRNAYLHVPFAHPGDGWQADPADDTVGRVYCPLGRPGDFLWARETWTRGACWWSPGRPQTLDPYDPDFSAYYRADGEVTWLRDCYRWRPSIHMPRWASRITLRVVAVRPERLHSITGRDIVAEGIPPLGPEHDPRVLRDDFARLWDKIYGGDPALCFSADCWAWRVEFQRVEAESS